jgi:malonate transporter and related proteins
MSVLNSLFPVFAVILLGALLKHTKIADDAFLKTSDRLVYYIFFPAMLFWKIGNPAGGAAFAWDLTLAVLLAVLAMLVISLLYVKAIGMRNFAVGSFSQCCYRFNTYVGMAVVLSTLGEEGGRYFGIIITFTIPFINVLAVATLIWFGDADYLPEEKLRMLLKALFSNPLILACMTGMLTSRLQMPFPAFLDNTFRLLSAVTLPMALISIGGSLSFAKLRGHLKPALVSALFKLLIFPAIGLLLLRAWHISGLALQTAMIFFALPTSTAIYILSSQLHSDADLASAAIVVSTVLSFASLSMVLVLTGT